MKPILALNANSVALMPFGFIRSLDSPTLEFNAKRQWFGERDIGIKQYARLFQKNNVKIMIKPQIWVWKGEFTGLIMMNSEDKWQQLESSYEEFIITYAKIAQEINADILCIGTELEKFVTNRPEFWKSLIKKIRVAYKGKLTYAANWDEFKKIPFWDELDFIGIDAYFPLTDLKSPKVIDFEKGWLLHKKSNI